MLHFNRMNRVHPQKIQAYQNKKGHENAQGGNHENIGSRDNRNELLKHLIVFCLYRFLIFVNKRSKQ
jgi:hypothetical protein